ncbi:high potential iron sulfur protein [Hansschlegelia quercus]|uniref:High potential iron-sulfur proteins family profile domain-containing protein n=1 Tax=Hansschlegelia quercus TaxID=2528245 RepID=A0A4Q9GE20_9HYPH|nr:hypothetical protein [Hansschlegelia quercus]TBN48649.1 hypothetical protein EYR15_13765 [Hansschlegelia quercus]
MSKPENDAATAHDSMNAETTSGVSRRALVAGFAAASVGVACLAMSRPARAQTKMSQADAKYQDSPKGSEKCAGCGLFAAPDACNAVDGKISPEGWCQLYSPKA